MCTRMVTPEGQRAVTHFQTEKAGHAFTLAALRLETGRRGVRMKAAHCEEPAAQFPHFFRRTVYHRLKDGRGRKKRDMRLRLQPCGWKRGGRIKSGCT
jgi:23S rRNA-/tRNA-specific pseudouridylate synthase